MFDAYSTVTDCNNGLLEIVITFEEILANPLATSKYTLAVSLIVNSSRTLIVSLPTEVIRYILLYAFGVAKCTATRLL